MTFYGIEEIAMAAAKPRLTGKVSKMVGLTIEVDGIHAAVGDAVKIIPDGMDPIDAEVVSVSGTKVSCMAYGDTRGVKYGSRVEAVGRSTSVKIGNSIVGRVLDGLGRPIDGKGPIADGHDLGLDTSSPHPLNRELIEQHLPLGVRALDTLIPCGRGQRLGIFAGSGVGKSSLLSMIARATAADVSVLALVGERGREVSEFVHRDLGEEGLARSVVVVATSDEPALLRIRAAFTATRIAEYFRDQGKDVVLMMDSLTRFAMAQREVGLSAGEPPATKGYPPSVFSLLPRLLEKAGSAERGSITGLYTVLVEGDDMNEPIADAARSLLDGHIVLSRALATSGHFPSIDVLESISRLEPAIVSADNRRLAMELRKLMAAYRDAKDLIEIGAYVSGTNPLVDRAVALREFIEAFLKQDIHEGCRIEESWGQLAALVNSPYGTPQAQLPGAANGNGSFGLGLANGGGSPSGLGNTGGFGGESGYASSGIGASGLGQGTAQGSAQGAAQEGVSVMAGAGYAV